MEMSQRTAGRMIRWISILCAFALALAMGITVWATAEPGTTIYIAEGKNDVNIRSQASTNSDPVGKLNSGAALTVVSVVSADGHNWYQVECVINGETKTGYIRDDLVEIPENSGEPADVETPEGAGEGGEGGEGSPEGEAPVPEGEGTPAPTSGFGGIDSLTPVDSGTDPGSLPAEFRPLVIEINGEQIPAWSDNANEYYLFCAVGPSGEAGWYLYDKINGECIRYKDFMGGGSAATVSSNGGDGVSKTAFIIVVVFCVLLVAATAVMGIKLMNGGGSDDYDDYDDDDDYDDEEEEPRARKNSVFRKFSGDDDDYEDEEDYEDEYDGGYDDRRRSSSRQTHQVAVQQGVRTARPVGEGRQPVMSREPAQSRQPVQGRPAGQGRPPVQGRPVSGGRTPVSGGRPAGQQGQPAGGMARPAGQQQARPSGGPAQGQQRYVQRQAGQQRYAQRTAATRRDDGEY